MSVVVKRPDPKHCCGPTYDSQWTWWETDGAGHFTPLHDEAGTVRACTDCGRTWVAVAPPPGTAVTVWRPEGRLERWWRIRRARDGGGP